MISYDNNVVALTDANTDTDTAAATFDQHHCHLSSIHTPRMQPKQQLLASGEAARARHSRCSIKYKI